MLDIDIMSKMGILFVRLSGMLTSSTKHKLKREVISLVDKVGINNIVINIQNLISIDESGLKMLIMCYKQCSKALLCVNYNQINYVSGLNYVTDEASAVNFIST